MLVAGALVAWGVLTRLLDSTRLDKYCKLLGLLACFLVTAGTRNNNIFMLASSGDSHRISVPKESFLVKLLHTRHRLPALLLIALLLVLVVPVNAFEHILRT